MGRFLAKELRRSAGALRLLISWVFIASSATAAQLIAIAEIPTPEQDPHSLATRLTSAAGISGDGSTIIGEMELGPFRGSFRWTKSAGFSKIDSLAQHDSYGRYNRVSAVSYDGSVIVGSSLSDTPLPPDPRFPNLISYGQEATRWALLNPSIWLQDLPGSRHISAAQAVSASGDVIVGWSSDANILETAVRWTPEFGIERFENGYGKMAAGVSADGRVTVANPFTGSTLAVVWSDEAEELTIEDLPGGEVRSDAYAISADGSTVVGLAASNIGGEAIRWTRDTGTVGLGLLPGGIAHSAALDVSADGSIIVGYSDSGDPSSLAFRWTPEAGMTSIRRLLENAHVDVSGWRFDSAIGI